VTDHYKSRLQAELNSLRVRRINARRLLDTIARGGTFGDPTHTSTLRRNTEIELRGTQPRWEALHHELGIEYKLGPPVRIGRRASIR